MRFKRLKTVIDNEWIQPVMKNYIMGCCDCGLVHHVNFRIVGEKIQLKASRAPKYTARLRKQSGIRLKGIK